MAKIKKLFYSKQQKTTKKKTAKNKSIKNGQKNLNKHFSKKKKNTQMANRFAKQILKNVPNH